MIQVKLSPHLPISYILHGTTSTLPKTEGLSPAWHLFPSINLQRNRQLVIPPQHYYILHTAFHLSVKATSLKPSAEFKKKKKEKPNAYLSSRHVASCHLPGAFPMGKEFPGETPQQEHHPTSHQTPPSCNPIRPKPRPQAFYHKSQLKKL